MTMFKLEPGDRYLLAFHEATAQRVWDSYLEAHWADMCANRQLYAETCTTPASSGLFALIEGGMIKDDPHDPAFIAEIDQWAEANPGSWKPIIDLFDERIGNTLTGEDVLAIAKCLKWEEAS